MSDIHALQAELERTRSELEQLKQHFATQEDLMCLAGARLALYHEWQKGVATVDIDMVVKLLKITVCECWETGDVDSCPDPNCNGFFDANKPHLSA
ncbi:hypothetical protein ACFW81_24040 [Streptomyces angustmyceticus]|uniref:hypothetical protein n=1 Tax=Streptomyces angustmyceticus TaxID=285578 RepID=UPI00369B8190